MTGLDRNPWGITAMEAKTLDALIAAGTDKAAARVLGLHPETVANHMGRARKKIAPGNRLQTVVWWDRWRRGEDESGASEVF